MPLDEKQEESNPHAESAEIDRLMVFRFEHSLGKGIKARIKSLGCSWNSLHHGWLCPLERQDEVQQAIQAAELTCSMQKVAFPKGMIPKDPKIAGKQSHLEILEEQIYKQERQLLQDVYQYDSNLRPEDFSEPSHEEGKSPDRIQIEKDFHNRWVDLQKFNEQAERLREEIAHLKTSKDEKIFDPAAPLLIADALISEQFLWNKQHRTLQYCSDLFWQWDGVKEECGRSFMTTCEMQKRRPIGA
jgi:putative DNA primase/helicase